MNDKKQEEKSDSNDSEINEMVELARQSLSSVDPNERANALRVLGEYGSSDDIIFIVPLLDDHNEHELTDSEDDDQPELLRYEAINSLLLLSDKCDTKFNFDSIIYDPDPFFRQYVALGLSLERAHQALENEQNDLVILRLAQTILLHGDRKAAEPILKRLARLPDSIGQMAEAILEAQFIYKT